MRNGVAIVVMGVSGAGKSHVGQQLATTLGLPFLEGDDFHSLANLNKMAGGVALNDADREPWLDAISAAIIDTRLRYRGLVVACSALKRAYRDRLIARAGAPLLFVYLNVDRTTLETRFAARRSHFMPVSLIDSQLRTLEPPSPDESAMTLDATQPAEELLLLVLKRLSLPIHTGQV